MWVGCLHEEIRRLFKVHAQKPLAAFMFICGFPSAKDVTRDARKCNQVSTFLDKVTRLFLFDQSDVSL